MQEDSCKTIKLDVYSFAHAHDIEVLVSHTEFNVLLLFVLFCSVSIFFMAKEKAECSLIPLKPKIFTPVLQHFKEGMHQKFIQDSGTGVNLRLFNDVDLSKVGKDNVYPLVVRMDIWTKGQPFDAAARVSEQPGSSLSKSATSRMIHAVIERKNEDYKVRVIKRIIWMDGTRYERHSIYGVSKNENDSEKQCVICMSEPKNTAVFPCRHMCMCNKCAKVIQSRSNLCPICRQPVVKYLELKDFDGW
ncbi:hypothetical protein O6H91_05G047600 [Diphasiastrum complanatum]|uniref:Uncharacterized protein n=1 Tax=Diphasiastrum complanatum TaxID=34168 RepID=A0ACC2DN99_DIPCM|nr:hypothetical protein O6H91_05G047600 [Diphasiastrum complanatum]